MRLLRLLCVAVALVAAAGWMSTARVEASPPAAAHGAAGHGAAADAHGGHAPDPLEWKGDLALWTLVVFLLLMAILGRFAWGPIASGLAKREKSIADQIAQAEHNHQESRRLLADYQQKLDRSQDEVRAILDQARRDAEQTGRDLIDKARTEAKREQEKAVRDIAQASSAAIKDLAEHSSRLAILLAGKIVGQHLRADDHAELIRRTLAEFPAADRTASQTRQQR